MKVRITWQIMIKLRNSETLLKLRIAVCHEYNVNAPANSSDCVTQKVVDDHMFEWLVPLALKYLSYDAFGMDKTNRLAISVCHFTSYGSG